MARQSVQNPDVGQPAVAVTSSPDGRFGASVAAEQAKPAVKTKFDGSRLVPDIQGARQRGGVAKTYKYWVGVTPSCPVQGIDLAGINFPKLNELLIQDPMGGPMKRRVPVIGALANINEHQVRRLMDALSRTVIRFTDNPGQKDEPGTGQNVGDLHQQPRKGHLITIPSPAEVAERAAAGKPTREYSPGPNDVPAARYIFAQLCADQERGSRGDFYPETLETAGFDWPEELN